MNIEFIIGGLMAVFLILFTMWLMGFKEWLVWAVAKAESVYGSKTGELKLRYAYNLAVEKYPILAKIIPFAIFKKIIDAALKVMNDMVKNNKPIKEAILGLIDIEEDGVPEADQIGVDEE